MYFSIIAVNGINCHFSVITEYRFGIASLINKKELLQIGDAVQFHADMNENFAVNIHATREKLRAMVEAMKGIFLYVNCKQTADLLIFPHFKVNTDS